MLICPRIIRYSRNSENGEKLLGYLENTVYNTTIPKCVQGKTIAHKVGMIPMNLIYNDTAVIFDTEPYTLANTTKGINYQKSQEVIAQIASIVDRHHELMIKAENDVQTVNLALSASKYDVPSSFFTIDQDTIPYYLLEKNKFGRESNPYKYICNIRNNSFHQQLVFLQKGMFVKQLEDINEEKTNFCVLH